MNKLILLLFIISFNTWSNKRPSRYEAYKAKYEQLKKARETKQQLVNPIPPVTQYSKELKHSGKKKVKLELDLETLVREVVRRNASIIYYNLQMKVAKEQIDYERAAFETNFFINTKKNIVNQENTKQEFITRGALTDYNQRNLAYEVGLGGLSPYGMEWSIKVDYKKENSSVIGLDDEYTNSLGLNLRTPLKKNHGRSNTQIKINLAKKGYQIAMAEYKRQIMDIIGTTIENYWKLVGANRLANLWQESLDIASKQREDLSIRVKSGNSPAIDLLSLDAAIALRKIEVNNNQAKINQITIQLMNALSIALNERDEINFTFQASLPTDWQVFPPFKESVALAKEYWPEFQIVENKLEMEEMKVKYAKNQKQPRFDFITGINNRNLNQNSSKSNLGKFFSDEYLSWYLGLEYAIPLGNTAAKVNETIAYAKLNQARLEKESMNRVLSNGIYDKLNQIELLKEQYQLYLESIASEKAFAKAQNELFNYGRLAIRPILEEQEKLMEYERRLANIIIELKLAEASLQKAVGTLLSHFDIEVSSLNEIESLPADF